MAIEMHTTYEAYLDSSVASMIPARLVPAQGDGAGGVGPLFEGSRLWEPAGRRPGRGRRARGDAR